MGILLVSKIPKPKPKQIAALMTLNNECPNPINSNAGMVSARPIAPVYILPLIFFCTHLSDKIPPAITPAKEDSAMVTVARGPASDMGIFKFCAKSVGAQFLMAQPGRLGLAK